MSDKICFIIKELKIILIFYLGFITKCQGTYFNEQSLLHYRKTINIFKVVLFRIYYFKNVQYVEDEIQILYIS